jgi:hypothetical protein
VHIKGMLSLGAAVLVGVALVSASGAGTAATPSAKQIDVSTRAAVVHYLRSIHVNPRGVVIQRGARNYAGPNCPGSGWACTSTAQTVVQVAPAGGKNVFSCSASRCAVVQASEAPLVTNTATCVRTTGMTQSCSISQTSSSANNEARVYMNATKLTGLTQTGSQTAQIVQTSTTGANTACVFQNTTIDGSTTAKKGMPVTVTLRAHQSITVSQNSLAGNSAGSSATPSGGCDTSKPLTQTQTLSSTAYGTASLTQLENDPLDPVVGPNMTLNLKQNQSAGYLNAAGGTNTMNFSQVNTLVADASGGVFTTGGPVTQTQGKPDGGIEATVNQFSTDPSTITAYQEENQCAHAQTTGSVPTDANGCFGVTRTNPLPAGWTQTQYGPVRKGGTPSTQGNNSQDTFGVTQNSTQKTDSGQQSQVTQNNDVEGDCTTAGNCHGAQTVNNNNGTTPNGNAGTGNVQFSTACTSSCTATANFPSGNILVSVGNGLVQMWNSTGTTLLHTFDTTKGANIFTTGLAFDSAGNLYVTDFNANDVSKFNSDGTVGGSFGSGYGADPESIVFAASGNAYVGQADGSKQVLEFTSSGAPVTSFTPAVQNRGTDWIDLAPDGCTLYYTSEGTSVKRFDVCTNTQLADFATGLPADAFAVKLLPGGGALVADTTSIERLDSSGSVVQTYGSNANANWFSLALDPSGTSFWASDIVSGNVTKFALSDGTVLASFNTGGTLALGAADGLAVAP